MQNDVFDIDSNVPLKSQPDVFVINKMLGTTAGSDSIIDYHDLQA